MTYAPLSVLKIDATHPQKAGRHHGEELRAKIAEACEVRWELMRNEPGFESDALLKEISLAHLPILQKFDVSLYEELVGISAGSNQSVERIIVLNHYTDLRDLSHTLLRKSHHSKENIDEGGCSTLFVPTQDGPILGQTWDIHSSALPFVIMLEIQQPLEDGTPSQARVFSMAGCLGMTGLNSQGLAITINNLVSLDAKIGLVWPALVRKVLRQSNALQAKECVMNADLGSGHHYTIADKDHLFAISTSGLKKKIITENASGVHFQTNHCTDDEMAKTHTVRAGSTTYSRYDKLKQMLEQKKLTNSQQVFDALGEISQKPLENGSHAVGTCGAIVMDIAQNKILACAGPPSEKQFNNPPCIF